MYEADVQNDPEPTRRIRPRSATVASVLLSLVGGLRVVATFALLSSIDESFPEYLLLFGFLQVLLSVTQVICGVLVWRGRSGARVVAVWLCAFGVIGALVALSSGDLFQSVVGVLINVVLIRLLNDREVLLWCDR